MEPSGPSLWQHSTVRDETGMIKLPPDESGLRDENEWGGQRTKKAG
jgi:hypothetical protein